MTILETLQIGNSILRAKNLRVVDFDDPKIGKVLRDLKDTMLDQDLIGLAGPQIGYNYQIFITFPRKTKNRPNAQEDELRIFINPKITFLSKQTVVMYEGCGSVANGKLFAPVKRSKILQINAIDQNGKRFSLKCDGILSRVIQHEFDHLRGQLFTDKITDPKKIVDVEFYRSNIRDSKKAIADSIIRIKEFE